MIGFILQWRKDVERAIFASALLTLVVQSEFSHRTPDKALNKRGRNRDPRLCLRKRRSCLLHPLHLGYFLQDTNDTAHPVLLRLRTITSYEHLPDTHDGPHPTGTVFI